MNLTPREIVAELDKHIIGQNDAKKAVAIALRNRIRRQKVAEPLRSEITPKNILIRGVKKEKETAGSLSTKELEVFLNGKLTLSKLLKGEIIDET